MDQKISEDLSLVRIPLLREQYHAHAGAAGNPDSRLWKLPGINKRVLPGGGTYPRGKCSTDGSLTENIEVDRF